METEKAIQSRSTIKILSDTEWGIYKPESEVNKLLTELMELALRAPFHYFCDRVHRSEAPLNSLLPWRCYTLDTKGCRDLAQVIKVNNIETGKILQMLHTCDALILVTWLPDEPRKERNEGELFAPTLKNMGSTDKVVFS